MAGVGAAIEAGEGEAALQVFGSVDSLASAPQATNQPSFLFEAAVLHSSFAPSAAVPEPPPPFAPGYGPATLSPVDEARLEHRIVETVSFCMTGSSGDGEQLAVLLQQAEQEMQEQNKVLPHFFTQHFPSASAHAPILVTDLIVCNNTVPAIYTQLLA